MGQDYRLETHVILPEDKVTQLLQNEVSSITELTDHRSIVSYLNNLNQDETIKYFKGSISSASKTAATGRVIMSSYIQSLIANKYKLYYMDTDSLIIDQPLPESMVSDTMLGKLFP